MTDESKPKPLFYVVLMAVVLGLLGYAFRNTLFPKGKDTGNNFTISKEELAKGGTEGVEGADANVPTTVKEYTFKSSEKLPPVNPNPYDRVPEIAKLPKFRRPNAFLTSLTSLVRINLRE